MEKINFNYDSLIEKIEEVYSESKIEYKLVHFSKDIKMKIDHLKKILDGSTYFQADEIMRAKEVLNLSSVDDIFFKLK